MSDKSISIYLLTESGESGELSAAPSTDNTRSFVCGSIGFIRTINSYILSLERSPLNNRERANNTQLREHAQESMADSHSGGEISCGQYLGGDSTLAVPDMGCVVACQVY